MARIQQIPDAGQKAQAAEPVPAADVVRAAPADPAAEQRKIRRRRMRALRSFLIRLTAFALVIYVLFFHLVGITFMPGRDMYPRLDAGDLLLYYRLEKNLKAQDIVAIRKAAKSGEEKRLFVCRVVAKSGDTVEVSDKGLTVNGNDQVETNIFYPTEPYENRLEYPVTLGADEYFVLADRRNGGMDSRYFGPVKGSEIEGVVITLLRRNNL